MNPLERPIIPRRFAVRFLPPLRCKVSPVDSLQSCSRRIVSMNPYEGPSYPAAGDVTTGSPFTASRHARRISRYTRTMQIRNRKRGQKEHSASTEPKNIAWYRQAGLSPLSFPPSPSSPAQFRTFPPISPAHFPTFSLSHLSVLTFNFSVLTSSTDQSASRPSSAHTAIRSACPFRPTRRRRR
jgi:hypothetical protein